MRFNTKVDMKGYYKYGLLLPAILVIITGCGGAVALNYEPSPGPAVKLAGPASARVVPFTDARGVNDPRLAGDIEETVIDIVSDRLELTEDVSTVVTGALSAELKAAGFSVADGPGGPGADGIVVSGEVKEFWFDIVEESLLSIELNSKITNAATGEELWSGVTKESATGFTGQTSDAVLEFMSASLQRVVSKVAAEAVGVAGAASVTVPGSPRSPEVRPEVKTPPPPAAPPAPVVEAAQPASVTPAVPEIESVPPAVSLAEGMGRIVITTDPPRAKVYIGDVYYGLSPQSIDLAPGVAEVNVKKNGYKTESEKVAVRDRVIVELEITLTK